MKLKLSHIAIFCLVLVLQSCTNDQPIPNGQLPSFEPKLVVNSALNNLEPIEISITDNAGAYTDDLPTEYSDVSIVLKADGSTISTTYNSSSKSFVANNPAIPGRTYTLEVSDNTGERSTVFARSFIPENVRNKSVGYIENGGVDMDGRPSDLLSIEWSDNAGSNYYMLHFYYYSETVGLFIPFEFELNDASLKAPETMKLNDGGFLFNDELFNGLTKKIEVVPPGGLVAANSDILYLIELRSVTRDFYNYYKTLQQYRDRDDLQQAGPFGSAVIVHSNITNGLGAFIASNIESDTIR